jgi:hypothetical protein
MHANCVFDVSATGNTGFVQTYLDTQRTLADSTTVSLTDDAHPSQVGGLYRLRCGKPAIVTPRASNRKPIPVRVDESDC